MGGCGVVLIRRAPGDVAVHDNQRRLLPNVVGIASYLCFAIVMLVQPADNLRSWRAYQRTNVAPSSASL
jgi:hypothetical protein